MRYRSDIAYQCLTVVFEQRLTEKIYWESECQVLDLGPQYVEVGGPRLIPL